MSTEDISDFLLSETCLFAFGFEHKTNPELVASILIQSLEMWVVCSRKFNIFF